MKIVTQLFLLYPTNLFVLFLHIAANKYMCLKNSRLAVFQKQIWPKLEKSRTRASDEKKFLHVFIFFFFALNAKLKVFNLELASRIERLTRVPRVQ